MKKILITGGTGFIGSHTAVALHENGYLPIIVDNFSNSDKSVLKGLEKICGQDFPFYEGDCGNSTFLMDVFDVEKDIAGVIHFAAYKSVNESILHPMKYYRNNIGSLITLLEVMIHRGVVPLVFSSSCTVYGAPDQVPVDESAPIKETPSIYGKTKQMCERMIADVMATNKDIKSVLLRYFNPVGAHPSARIGELPLGVPNNLVPYITQTAAGIREKITVFGDDYNTPDGTCIRDYIHVVDLADAHVKAFEYLDQVKASRCCDHFNVGTGRGHSVMEVLKNFQEINGFALNYRIGARREGDVASVYADANKAKVRMGWQAKLTLADALKDAWRWECALKDR